MTSHSSDRVIPDLAGSASATPVAQLFARLGLERRTGTLVLFPRFLHGTEIRLCFEHGWLVGVDQAGRRDLYAVLRAGFAHVADYAFYSGASMLSSDATPCALDPLGLLRLALGCRPRHERATLEELGARMAFRPSPALERLGLTASEQAQIRATERAEVTLEPGLLYLLFLVGAVTGFERTEDALTRAREAHASGRLALARSILVDAIAAEPERPGLHAALARVWLAWGSGPSDSKRALLCANAALRLDRNYVDAHIAKGHALARLEWHDRADLHYGRALELDPTHVEARHALEESGSAWSLAHIAKVLGLVS